MKKSILSALLILTNILVWGQQQLTNIPTIYINTENSQAVNSKETYVKAEVTIVSDNKDDEIENKPAGIRGRGNSTWGMAKKPYRLKFDKKINLFNRPAKAKSWTLLANYADKTLMRNAVAFEISRFMGFDFSPTAVFADVVLNGLYLGNYMVSDQMEVNKGRVDIDEMDETCIEGESLTGGYFLEIDGFGGSEPVHFTTNKGLIITVKSPDDDVIQAVQFNYIKNYINNFERDLFATDYDDPEGGFRKWVDEKSLIDWYIACELTGNSDSFWSTYIYKKRNDDKLYFGPLWDYDIAFNNDNRLGDAVNKLMREDAHEPKTWIKRMWSAGWFRKAVYDRWREIRSQGIEDYIINFIDETAEYLDQSQRKNFQKWNVLNKRVYREEFLFNTYEEGVDYLKEYITRRLAFLDMSFRASGAQSLISDIKDGEEYYILHYVGLYATPESSNFYIENPLKESQKLTFVATPTSGIWNIRTNDGRLVASKDGDKYCTYVTDGTDAHAQFIIEESSYDGYAKIRNVKTNKYLGVEHTAHNSRISTNKDGTLTNHAWKILPVNFTNSIGKIDSSDVNTVYYNPHTQSVVSDECTQIIIYNLQGQIVAHVDSVNAVNVGHLAPGLYIIHTPTTTQKFIK